jgi:hypothetical protein
MSLRRIQCCFSLFYRAYFPIVVGIAVKFPASFSSFVRSGIYSKFFDSKLDTQFSGSICSISILASYRGIRNFRIFSADKGMTRAYIGNNHRNIVEHNSIAEFHAARELF